jgi:hypothetical protein
MLFNDFASTFCCRTAVRTGLHNASVRPSRNIASSRTSSNNVRYTRICFACIVTTVGYEVSDVTFVNSVQQSTGKVARIIRQIEITYSTTGVEFITTIALMVLIER